MSQREEEAEDVLPDALDWTVKEQLGQLRAITRRTGIIHEGQMLQLKVWPRLLFPCDQHAIEYDSEQRTLVITMRMLSPPDALPDIKDRIKMLEKWTWALLGPEWLVRLRYRIGKKGGRSKELSHGRRKVAAKTPEPAETYGLKATTEFRRYRQPDSTKVKPEELPPILPQETT